MHDPLLREAETVPLATVLPRPKPSRLGMLIGFAFVAVVLGLVVGPRTIKVYGGSKAQIAKTRVKQLAYECYPQWRLDHAQACPKNLAALAQYSTNKSIKDPWGAPYLFTCGGHRIYVVSLGEDGQADTADDIWSHQ